ncbi:MAG TPA: DUF6029 family protein [Chitinophagales bacterium]|nr:DUF6029 family protein [Chitinophagales bacterium]
MKYGLYFLLLLCEMPQLYSQGSFSGGLQLNAYFYDRDSLIGASGTPHYDNLKSSTDAWLNLDYTNDRYLFDSGIRLDVFTSSNLHNPGVPYSAIGIGNFYIRKRGEKYKITGGYFYDQFGSGIVFRAYEDRTLGIDNSILGIHLEAEPVEQLKVKAFTGVHKNRLSLFKPVIIGMNVESHLSGGEKVRLIPGASIVKRTLDDASMDFVVSTIETYDPEDRFVPKYNVYVFGAYTTLTAGDFSWYVEGAGKTTEAIVDATAMLVNSPGNVIYTTLNYSRPQLGMALQFKRTENFPFRTSPKETLLDGVINFIPPVTRQNSLRLPARYNAAVQDLEELAYSADVNYSPVAKKITLNFNYAEVRDFDHDLKFREAIGDVELKFKKEWKGMAGLQFIQYNQLFYEKEVYGNYALVKAFAPFAEFTWKVNKKHSFTFDAQAQFTDEDFGSWLYGAVEYNIAPWFSIAASDMYNYQPNPERMDDKIHYYQFFTSFTYRQHVLTLAYAKQVAGIVCTGGVCRYEPAFSGVKLTLNSSF